MKIIYVGETPRLTELSFNGHYAFSLLALRDRTEQMQARLEKHILLVCVLVYILITSRSPKRACS